MARAPGSRAPKGNCVGWIGGRTRTGTPSSLGADITVDRLTAGAIFRGLPWSYGDKRTRNKRFGPGGGTRRLHQTPSLRKGSPWGRNRIDGRVKVLPFARWDSAVTGSKRTIANDNRAPVAIAA